MLLPGCMFFASMTGALGPPGYGGGGSVDILAGCLCEKSKLQSQLKPDHERIKQQKGHIFVPERNI